MLRWPSRRRDKFSRAGWSHAENQIVALDGFHVAPLIHSLGRQQFLSKRPLPAARDQRAQANLGIFGADAKVTVQIAVIENMPFAHQGDVVFQDVFGARNVGRLALDFERVVDQLRADLQSRLK